MSTTKRIILSKRSIERFLDGKLDSEIVGRRGTDHSCPLAEVIKAQGGEVPRVNAEHISYYVASYGGTRHHRKHTPTTRAIMRAVDNYGYAPLAPDSYYVPRPEVTAKELRAILAHL